MAGYSERISNPNPHAREWLDRLPARAWQGRIGLAVECPHAFALAFHRLLEGGATPVLAPTLQERGELGLSGCIHDEGWEGLPGQASPLLNRYIAFSSGSSGSRRAFHFHRQFALANARAHAQALSLSSQDLLIQTLRLHHPFGVVAYLFAPLASGCSIELGTFFDGAFRERDKPVVVHLTPYHLELLHKRNFATRWPVSRLTVGAGPLPRSLALYGLSLCQQLHTTYGLSEAGPRVSSGKVDPETFVDGWIGYPLEGVQLELLEQNELAVSTPYAPEGQATVRTGDRVEILGDGSLVFRDRLGDRLRLRGQSVPRAAYQKRLEDSLGWPCQLAQRPYSDALILFLEGQEDGQVSARVARDFPELKGARLLWVEQFRRSALGKVDLPRMLEDYL